MLLQTTIQQTGTTGFRKGEKQWAAAALCSQPPRQKELAEDPETKSREEFRSQVTGKFLH